jgi:hypothetical protein
MWQNRRTLLSAPASLLLFVLTTACGPEEAIDVQSTAQALGGEFCLATVAGKYCGNDGMIWADPNTLYSCPGGAWMAPTSATYCSYGCITAAAGKNDYCKSGPATPVMINPNNLTIFQHGNYSGYYLLWDDNTMKGTQGGWRFQFNTSYDVQKGTKTRINESDDTTGQCATLAKQLSADAIPRIPWQRGDNVMTSGSVPIGTAIATFSSAGSYDNGHSGYFGGYVYDSATGLPNGFIMYDENWTYEGLVGSHTLKTSGSTYLSNAGSYYVATATP